MNQLVERQKLRWDRPTSMANCGGTTMSGFEICLWILIGPFWLCGVRPNDVGHDWILGSLNKMHWFPWRVYFKSMPLLKYLSIHDKSSSEFFSMVRAYNSLTGRFAHCSFIALINLDSLTSPKQKYIKSLLLTLALIHCMMNFNLLSPLNAPHPNV